MLRIIERPNFEEMEKYVKVIVNHSTRKVSPNRIHSFLFSTAFLVCVTMHGNVQ